MQNIEFRLKDDYKDMIKNKKASGRFQDLADVRVLEKILEKRSR